MVSVVLVVAALELVLVVAAPELVLACFRFLLGRLAFWFSLCTFSFHQRSMVSSLSVERVR